MSALRLLNPTRFRKSYVPYSATLQQSRESFPRLLPALQFNDIMQGVYVFFPRNLHSATRGCHLVSVRACLTLNEACSVQWTAYDDKWPTSETRRR